MRALKLLAVGVGLLVPAVALAQAAPSYGFATYAARINAAGNIAASTGLQSVSHTGTGTFDLVFARDINTCVPAASILTVAPGMLNVILKAGANNTFTVATYSPSGIASDRAFSIIVSCGP